MLIKVKIKNIPTSGGDLTPLLLVLIPSHTSQFAPDMLKTNKGLSPKIQKMIKEMIEQEVGFSLSKHLEPRFFLTRPEAARFCRTSQTNFDRLVKKGKIRHIKQEGRVVFKRAWVIEDMERMQGGSGGEEVSNAD